MNTNEQTILEEVNENLTMSEKAFIERLREIKEPVSVDIICEDLLKKFFDSLPKEIIPGEKVLPLEGGTYKFAYLRKSANSDEDIFVLYFDSKKNYLKGNEEAIKASIAEFADKVVESFTVRGLYYDLEMSKSVSKQTIFILKFFLDINDLLEMA